MGKSQSSVYVKFDPTIYVTLPPPGMVYPLYGAKRGVGVISAPVRAIYRGDMTISDFHETEAPNLWGKITHAYGVVVWGYNIKIPIIPIF